MRFLRPELALIEPVVRQLASGDVSAFVISSYDQGLVSGACGHRPDNLLELAATALALHDFASPMPQLLLCNHVLREPGETYEHDELLEQVLDEEALVEEAMFSRTIDSDLALCIFFRGTTLTLSQAIRSLLDSHAAIRKLLEAAGSTFAPPSQGPASGGSSAETYAGIAQYIPRKGDKPS